ncbi:2768_t:CDS:1, partial [Racocetra persica]
MFICGVCSKKFSQLTSLKNHKKVHKNRYQVEDDTNISMDSYNSDEFDNIIRQNYYHIEGETDTSMDTYSFDKLDIKSRQNDYHYIDDEIDTSTDSYGFDELDVISRQVDNLIFDDQESDNESNSTFDTQSIAGGSNLVFNDQEIINEFNQFDCQEISDQNITCDMIMNEVDKLQSDESEHSDDNEMDSSGFSSTAYQEFINIVIILLANLVKLCFPVSTDKGSLSDTNYLYGQNF